MNTSASFKRVVVVCHCLLYRFFSSVLYLMTFRLSFSNIFEWNKVMISELLFAQLVRECAVDYWLLWLLCVEYDTSVVIGVDIWIE